MNWIALVVFYRNFRALTIGASLFGCVLYFFSGENYFIVPLLWSKLIANSLVLVFFHLFMQDRLFFFYNLGVTRLELYVSTFVIDLGIWAALIYITSFFL